MASDGCRVASIRTERERGGETESIRMRRNNCGNVLKNIREILESRFFSFKNCNSYSISRLRYRVGICVFL